VAKLISELVALLPMRAKSVIKFTITFLLGSTFMLTALAGEEHVDAAVRFLNWILSFL